MAVAYSSENIKKIQKLLMFTFSFPLPANQLSMVSTGKTYQKKTDLGRKGIHSTLDCSCNTIKQNMKESIEAYRQDLNKCQRQRENQVSCRGNARNQLSDFSTAKLEYIKNNVFKVLRANKRFKVIHSAKIQYH